MNARAGVLFVASLLLLFGASVHGFAGAPHLRGDLVEIAVRPTLLRAVMVAIWIGVGAMFTFALIVGAAALRAASGGEIDRAPLFLIAVFYIAFGIYGYAIAHSIHSLGFAAFGIVVAIGAAMRSPQSRSV